MMQGSFAFEVVASHKSTYPCVCHWNDPTGSKRGRGGGGGGERGDVRIFRCQGGHLTQDSTYQCEREHCFSFHVNCCCSCLKRKFNSWCFTCF